MRNKKRVLVAMLVSLGLFSYQNAFQYVETLTQNALDKVIKTYQSLLKTNINNRELIGCGHFCHPEDPKA